LDRYSNPSGAQDDSSGPSGRVAGRVQSVGLDDDCAEAFGNNGGEG
jgi:hypothetical protein